MKHINFSFWNKLLAWVAFAIALITFALTAEPTASFWDAGEYISTSAKLQVGHPPGAPFYQIFGAFFSMFAADETQIAFMVNLMSGVASAFTVLFMFWSITLILKKILRNVDQTSNATKIAVLASSFVGATSFTFTDSFWFSAVEAEVYAMAICIMSAMFYVGLLWERDMHKPRGNRWFILICLMIGLSFGVHFMGLLTIPAIGLLYYFKNTKKVTTKNFIIAHVVVVAILLFIFKFLLPYTLTLFGTIEVFVVNNFGLPFHSGTILTGIGLIALIYFALRYTRQHNYKLINTIILGILFIFIGFSSWIMLPIRANAGTVINENNPSSARALLAYYNREQYPEQKLFYGPQFTEAFAGLDPDNPYFDDEPLYEMDREKGEYVIVNNYKNHNQNTDDTHKAFLARMWSTEHAENYLKFTGPLEVNVKQEYLGEQELVNSVRKINNDYALGKISDEEYVGFLRQISQYVNIGKPSTASNFNYLFQFQMGYMYWRYFMWNFVGRQNDTQGKLTNFNGNWLSGIDFIDEMFIGSQKNLPDEVKFNKARNTYFFLPLILGIIGLIFHFRKDINFFWVLMVFFLFTGIALKIYLNERPFEPRERDYALVGSFYVFAIWIGIGVFAIFDFLKDKISPKIVAPLVGIVCLIAVPGLLAQQNWDDHDRSDRYTTLAMAKKYLDAVEENGILFTIGDNDTFALWYAQEIEGYRRDVRTINTSLFATDWYIDQMKRKAYTSDPVKTILEHDDFVYSVNDAVFFREDPRFPKRLNIKKWMQYIKSDNPSTKEELENGQIYNTFPTKKLSLPVNVDNAIKAQSLDEKDRNKAVDTINFTLGNNVIYKNRMMMLDVLASNEWERPIYFTGGSYSDADYIWLKDYLQLEGIVYKLTPIKTKVNPKNPFDMGRIDSDRMYEQVMQWEWGNLGSDKIYHDPETRKNAITYRSNLARLVEVLLKEGKNDKAEKILDLAMEKMPVKYFGFDSLLEPFILGYYEIGKPEEAREIWYEVATKHQQWLTYYSGLKQENQIDAFQNIYGEIEKYRSLVDILVIAQDEEIMKDEATKFNGYIDMFAHFFNDQPESEIPVDEIDNLSNDQQKDSVNLFEGTEMIPN
ncbi:MAG: glycosyltransferase family 117 protein [Psychroflexus halocasei]